MDVWKCNKPSNLGECSHRLWASMMIGVVVVVLMFVIYNLWLACLAWWLEVLEKRRASKSEMIYWLRLSISAENHLVLEFSVYEDGWYESSICCAYGWLQAFSVLRRMNDDEKLSIILPFFSSLSSCSFLAFWMEHIFYVLCARSHFFFGFSVIRPSKSIFKTQHTISDISLLIL